MKDDHILDLGLCAVNTMHVILKKADHCCSRKCISKDRSWWWKMANMVNPRLFSGWELSLYPDWPNLWWHNLCVQLIRWGGVVQWVSTQTTSILRYRHSGWDEFNLYPDWPNLCTQLIRYSVGFYSHDGYLALSAVIWLRTRDGLHHDPHPGPPPLRSEWAADGRPGPAGQVLHWQGESTRKCLRHVGPASMQGRPKSRSRWASSLCCQLRWNFLISSQLKSETSFYG